MTISGITLCHFLNINNNNKKDKRDICYACLIYLKLITCMFMHFLYNLFIFFMCNNLSIFFNIIAFVIKFLLKQAIYIESRNLTNNSYTVFLMAKIIITIDPKYFCTVVS